MGAQYDAIIIGSGIGGLICGTYLAKSGLRVLMLEQHFQAGGCCSAFQRKGYIFDAGAHVLGSCGEGQSLEAILSRLGVSQRFIRMNPTDIAHFPEEDFRIPADINEFSESLQKTNHRERDQIARFFNDILRMTQPDEINYFVRKYRDTSYQQFLDNYLEDQRTKAILSAQCGYCGLPPEKLSAITAVLMFKSYNRDGSYYPEGGSQAFTDAIVKQFENFGGELCFSRKVGKVLVRNREACGVQTEDGETFYAKTVISNADARSLFFDMLGENDGADDKIMQKLKEYELSISAFILYLGLKIGKDMLVDKNGWYHSSYDLNKDFRTQMYIAVPTLYDSALGGGPGREVMISYSFFPDQYHDAEDLPGVKKGLQDQTCQRLESFFPGLSNKIAVREAATPGTLLRYTSNSEGALYGWAQNPDQVFLRHFPASSGIKNMFLAGHWTYPGGGVVPVAISGMHAAKLVVQALRSG